MKPETFNRSLAPAKPLLDVGNLSIRFGTGAEPVVRGVSFTVERGQCLAIVGESGSGKSVTARSLIGLSGRGADVRAARLEFDGANLLGYGDKEWRRLRGAGIGFVLQDALVSLDPLRVVGREVAEAVRIHAPDLSAAELEARVIELLTRVGIPNPEIRARQLPSELSGGLRQRALIATAIAGNPDLLVADEPTTALDVTVQAQILALLEQFKSDGKGIVLISHDLAVVGNLADRIAVMKRGEIVEAGPSEQILFDPRHEYTRLLLSAVPTGKPRGVRLSPTPSGTAATPAPKAGTGEIVAKVEGVSKHFASPTNAKQRAVEDVSFVLRSGETLGVVGESGSGKTTTSRILLGLTAPDSGHVEVGGQRWDRLRGRDRRHVRRSIQIIYQDTLSSFDPRYTVGRVIDEAIAAAGVAPAARRRARAIELLDSVGLPETFYDRRPIEMSGGQRQRVAIARALAGEPKIIVCDESVSALDVSIQAQVLDLLVDIQRRTGVAYLFISHDLGVINHISDRVIVMKEGRIVEEGTTEATMDRPNHPYTRELMAAIPRIKTSTGRGQPA